MALQTYSELPDRWGERVIARFPDDLQSQVRARWSRIAGDGPRYPGIRHANGLAPSARANLDLTAQWQQAVAERIHIAFNEDAIRERARSAADTCLRMQRIPPMIAHARSLGIEPPQARVAGDHGPQCSIVGMIRRMQSEHWWRRQMRRAYTRTAEAHLRTLGVVHRKRQVYASDRVVAHRRARNRRNEAMLREMLVVSDAGEQLELWEVIQKSQANPAIRRNELMVRLKGFEEVAQAAGHVAEFVTLTCPSAYHRTHADGSPNERWEGHSPRAGQQWLSKMWARARAKLHRLKLLIYGFRVAEPHHDGTPHWHLVLFMRPSNLETLRTVLRCIWLAEYGNEPGASKHRASFKHIDPHKGSAVGYLAKYVAKNIDGHEVGEDFETTGTQAAESCHRVGAWSAAHGIRQFQQIGGPAVTVWRELRRLRDVLVPDEIRAAQEAADAGDWAGFIAAIGGIECGRRGRVGLWTETTGELNQYDEPRGPQIAGVRTYEETNTAIRCGDSVSGAGRNRAVRSGIQTDTQRMGAVVESAGVAAQLRGGADAHISGGFACAAPADHRKGCLIRTREKVWRIQRKAPEGGITGRSGCELRGPAGQQLRNPPVSPLGPVSITVREFFNDAERQPGWMN